jgi:chaperonin GroES
MKFKPLHDRVLVKRMEAEEKTKGGIIIPETGKEKPGEAKVIAVGPGRIKDDGKRIGMDVKKGDLILISKWGGNEIKLDGEEHLILKEDEVLGIIEK